MQSALKGEACSELPACIVFLLPEPALIEELLELHFNQFPSSTNQSGSILTNQDSGFFFWTSQTWRIWSPHLHEERPIRDQGQGLFSIQVSSIRGFPFPLMRRENYMSLDGGESPKTSISLDQSWETAEQSKAELSSQKGPLSRAPS